MIIVNFLRSFFLHKCKNQIYKIIFVKLILLLSSSVYAQEGCPFDEVKNIFNKSYEQDLPITTDNRIKTYIYNPNEVYLLVLHFGFQSHIEFGKNEEVQTITLGDAYAWKITPLGNKLFIKPLEKDIRTNMTVITNKKTYIFDIASVEHQMGNEKDLVYVIRFYYPKKRLTAY